MMNRSSQLRLLGLIFLTLALAVCLSVWKHHLSPIITGVQQTSFRKRPFDGARANSQNGSDSIQRLSRSSESVISQQAEIERFQSEKPEVLYRALQESHDPKEKRTIRKQIAALKPGEVPFRFALSEYENTNDEEDKLHIQSILAQIDVSGLTSEVAVAASQTQDEALFVSFAYSLRNSKNVLGKQELLKLAANNQLSTVNSSSLMANQGMVALHRCLLDILTPSDYSWINEYRQTTTLNPLQNKILTDFFAKSEHLPKP